MPDIHQSLRMTTVAQLVDRAAAWYGDAVAVDDGTRRLSFRQVGARSSRLANALRSLGSQGGARVALLMPNRTESVEVDFGIAKAGKVRVPINPRLTDSEREYLLANSGSETLIFDAQFEAFAVSVRGRLPQLRNLVIVGGASDSAQAYEELLEAASPSSGDIEHPPDAPNFILYTSGTTGRPKGATATNRSRLAATLNMLADEIDAVPGDAMIHAGSMTHGSGSKVLAYFCRGARNLPMAKFEPDRFLHLVARERATATFVVPTMISMLLEAAQNTTADTSSLKTVSYGGAPIATETLEEALARFGNVFVQVYGSCEAPHPVTVLRKVDHVVSSGRGNHLASIGREAATVEVRIAGQNGEDQPSGERGEMWVRGENVMSGYWGDPAATSEVLRDGWYQTGDVATRDDEGYYYIVDRARDMIITGGLNVYPAEVEAAIYKYPGIAEVAVIGIPDDHWGETVKAFVVVKPGFDVTAADILAHARALLAAYKKPTSIDFVQSLPKGSTGKILKRELKAPFWAGSSRGVH
jgi:long-chain acyl-CoA synthetase